MKLVQASIALILCTINAVHAAEVPSHPIGPISAPGCHEAATVNEADSNEAKSLSAYDDEPDEAPKPQDGKPTTVSVMYLLNLVYPDGFIEKIEQHNPKLAMRLQCTKIGQSGCEEDFYKKMGMYSVFIPFARVRYVGIKIDPSKIKGELFVSEDAEGAMHLKYTPWHVSGEWYNLDGNQRNDIVNRLKGLGGEALKPWTNVLNKPCTNRPQPNPDHDGPGYVYLAKLNWGDDDLATIKEVMKGTENHEHRTTCMRMLSTKIGYSKRLKWEDGKQGRGKDYIWTTSFLASMKYKGMVYTCMKKGEWELHQKYDTKSAGSGEWFDFDETDIEANIIDSYKSMNSVCGKVVEGEWSRKKDPDHVRNMKKWLKAGLIMLDEVVVLTAKRYLVYKKTDKALAKKISGYYDCVKEVVEWGKVLVYDWFNVELHIAYELCFRIDQAFVLQLSTF